MNLEYNRPFGLVSSFLHPIGTHAMYVWEDWNFAFLLHEMAINLNFFLCLAWEVQYLGHWNEFGVQLAVWTRLILAFRHPIGTHAKYVREYWNFAFSLFGMARTLYFYHYLARKVWYLGHWNEFGVQSAVWTRLILAYLHPIRTDAMYVREDWNFTFLLSGTAENSNFFLCLAWKVQYLGHWNEFWQKIGHLDPFHFGHPTSYRNTWYVCLGGLQFRIFATQNG
jgi:hypothetical protein